MQKRYKTVAIVPIKTRSRRIKGKNFIKINGKPLYRYLLDKLKYCKFDEVFVDSNSEEIKKYCSASRLIITDKYFCQT